MSDPKTLLQMAGAPLDPASFSEATLVIIDAQGEYKTGHLPLDGIDAALGHLETLLGNARRHGAPVIHIAHAGRPGGLFDRAAAGGAILPQAAPEGDEAVIEKGLPNSFAGTELHERLGAIGRKQLILAGFMTHMCVSSTARAALDLGYRVTVAADATATRSLPDPAGGAPVAAADLQRASLAALADRFAIVAPVRDIGA